MKSQLPQAVTDGCPPAYLGWYYLQNTSNLAFFNCTLGGSLFVLYLGTMKMDVASIGLVVSLFPFLQLVALTSGGLVEQTGFRRAFFIFHGIRKIFVIALVAAPAVLAAWGPAAGFWFVVSCVTAFGILRALGETALYPWMKEFIPDACRGRVQGNAVILSALISVAGLFAISLLIQHSTARNWEPELPFQIAFVIFPLIALAGVFGTKHLPGGETPQSRKPARAFIKGQFQAAKDACFRRYVLAEGLMFGVTALFAGIMPVFLLKVARIPDQQIVLLGGAQMAGIIISGMVNGRAVDRLGSRRILPRFLVALMIMPALWLFIPRLGVWCVPSAFIAYLLFGFFQNGTSIALIRMLYNDIVPRRNGTEYFTLRYAGSGLLAGFFPLLGGLSIDWMRPAGESELSIIAFAPAFLACSLGALVAICAIISIRTEPATSPQLGDQPPTPTTIPLCKTKPNHPVSPSPKEPIVL